MAVLHIKPKTKRKTTSDYPQHIGAKKEAGNQARRTEKVKGEVAKDVSTHRLGIDREKRTAATADYGMKRAHKRSDRAEFRKVVTDQATRGHQEKSVINDQYRQSTEGRKNVNQLAAEQRQHESRLGTEQRRNDTRVATEGRRIGYQRAEGRRQFRNRAITRTGTTLAEPIAPVFSNLARIVVVMLLLSMFYFVLVHGQAVGGLVGGLNTFLKGMTSSEPLFSKSAKKVA